MFTLSRIRQAGIYIPVLGAPRGVSTPNREVHLYNQHRYSSDCNAITKNNNRTYTLLNPSTSNNLFYFVAGMITASLFLYNFNKKMRGKKLKIYLL